MRAVLIVNPNATSTTPAGRDLLAHALESRVELTVAHTNHRYHAAEIAREAAQQGVDAVIAHGGDGTVHEVVNGLLGPPGNPLSAQAPAVGVVPGGSANVFARALGISPDPVEATNQLIDLLSAYRVARCWRRIGLMNCGEHWAVFTAGMGVDGEVVAAVDAQRRKGRKVTAARYIRTAVPVVVRSGRRAPALTLHLPGREPIPGVHLAFVSNSNPWTYHNSRPMWTNPTTTFDTGLGVFAATRLKPLATALVVRQMFSSRPRLDAPQLIRDDDVPWLRICADPPVATQIDGEYVGALDTMTFTSVPDALSVIAPPAKTPPDLQ